MGLDAHGPASGSWLCGHGFYSIISHSEEGMSRGLGQVIEQDHKSVDFPLLSKD